MSTVAKRSHHKKKPLLDDNGLRHFDVGEKPSLGLPDPLEAAQEACRAAQEGNVKLARAVDVMRQALELIVIAEMDRATGRAVTERDLRSFAMEALDKYSALTGQSWKRHKIIGSWAGDKSSADNYNA
jgi:hypothetical protein